ncbi:MAG: hypothetical protein ACYSN9_01760, partial [Planctomycetota bacterium]
MSDEKKDHDLDADILQSKADILKALRAAGKPTPNRPDTNSEVSSKLPPEEDTLNKADIIDLTDDEPESEDFIADELISDFPEDELTEEPAVRIMPFEESQQDSSPTNSSFSDIIESPVSPEFSSSSVEHDLDTEQLRRENRQLNDRVSALLEENTRLKADLQDYLQTSNQVQRFRSELSEAEVALSREHSKTRLLETKINEIESLKALLEQDCRSLSERIEQLQQEKQQSKDALERIQDELSESREKTGRQIVDLNQKIEQLTGDSEVLKNDYEQIQQEGEVYRSQ